MNPSGTIVYWTEGYSCSDIGTWYFKFNATDTEGNSYETSIAQGDYVNDDNSFTIEKDDVSFTLISGDGDTVTKEQSTTFILALNDTDSSGLITEIAKVDVEVTLNNSNIWLTEASETQTNSSGYLNYQFYASCKYDPGWQKWRVKVSDADSCYQSSYSSEYTVYLDIACPEFNVTQVFAPQEVFQYKPFGLNATLRIKDRNATNTNITLLAPNWNVNPSKNQYLGKIEVGLGETKYVPVHWDINVTSLAQKSPYYKLNVTANTSDEIPPINYYEDWNSTIVKAYEYEELNVSEANNETDVTDRVTSQDVSPGTSADNSTVEALVMPGKKLWVKFNCTSGIGRLNRLKLFWEANGSTTARIEIWNGTKWKLRFEEFEVGENLSLTQVDFLNDEIGLSSESKCLILLENEGNKPLYVDKISLERYFVRKVRISDIQWSSEDGNLFNLTVIIANPFSETYSGNLTLNLTDGEQVFYSSTQQFLEISSGITKSYFYNIDLSTFEEKVYYWVAEVKLNTSEIDKRVEEFDYLKPKTYVYVNEYTCPNTTEEVIVDVIKTLEEESDINISLEVPSGWSYEPSYYYFHDHREKEISVEFNLNTSSSIENVSINVSIFTSYPDLELNFTQVKQINVSNAIQPVIEIIRETPTYVAPDKVFESALIIHNKGCAATNELLTLKENISSGWTPANPTLSSNLQLVSASVDLENNVITWVIGYIGVNEYGVASYQVKSPTSSSTEGYMNWELQYAGRIQKEYKRHYLQTSNYTSESHLEYSLLVEQREAYPWEEPRSIQPNMTYNFSLKVTNIGDVNATNWTIYLPIPSYCNVTWTTGDWNETERLIKWNLSELPSRSSEYLNFTLNCSYEGKIVLEPFGIKNTTGSSYYEDSVSYFCSNHNCTTEVTHTFQHPSMPYERLTWLGIQHLHHFAGYNVTIGEMNVELAKDSGEYQTVHQHYDFEPSEENVWANASITPNLQDSFKLATRKIKIFGHT
ncbi:MAG: hypothetical protein DRN61_04950, partial [Thaumarchaeota archaeon]